jgi:hypothetical protein
MKEISDQTLICLRDEKDRLLDDVRQCDMCSTSLAEHRSCYVASARESGRRSKACFL